MEELLIPIVGIVFPIGGSAAVAIVWMTFNYRKRRRLMELHHAERMAAIERGMELPPLPIELIDGGMPRRRRSSLLPGLVWALIGLAIAGGTLITDGDYDLLVGGLIALGIGLAYLIYYSVEGREVEARWLERDLQKEKSG